MPELLEGPPARRWRPRRAAGPFGSGALAEALARVVHDLVAPLTVIRGQCVALARSVPDPGVRVRAAAIDAEAVRLAEALDGIAGLVHPALARRPARTPIDLGEFAAAVAERHRPTAEHAGVRLLIRADGPQATVIGTRSELRRLLDNLLRNALRHTPAGGTIRVAVVLARRRALVTVQDDGPGVHPDDRERIFLPGERGRGARGAGQGLGLAIAREIAQAHGGTLTVADHPTGARLVLRLPLSEAQRFSR